MILVFYQGPKRAHFTCTFIFCSFTLRQFTVISLGTEKSKSPSRVWDSQVESRQSRLNRDSWTLCKGFREVRGHAPSEKMRNWRPSNCWKCIGIVNPTTTTLILYHLEFFTIPLGGNFWLLGGGGACAPREPPPLPTGLSNRTK